MSAATGRRKGKKKTRRGHALLNNMRGSSNRRYAAGGALPALSIATGRRGRGMPRTRKPGSEYANSPPKRSAKARVANMHKKWLQHTTQMAASDYGRGTRSRAITPNASQVGRGRGKGRGRGPISEILHDASTERNVDSLASVSAKSGPRSQLSSKDGGKQPRYDT